MSDEPTPGDTPLQALVTEEIKVLALRRGMSHTQLAERAGMKQAYLSRRMTGQKMFDLSDLEKLADALDVDVLAFFPTEPAAPPALAGSPLVPRVLVRGGGGARRRRHRGGESGELSSYSAIPTERTGCVAPPRPTSTNRPMPATAVTTPDRPPGHGPTPIAPRQRRTARLNPA